MHGSSVSGAHGNPVMRSLAVACSASRTGIGTGRILLALAMIALGMRGFAFGDFAGTWQRIPIANLPAHDLLVYLTALAEAATGIGILVQRVAKPAAAAMAAFALLWLALLKLPAIFAAPLMEYTWSGAGEIAAILAGAWVVFAALSSPAGKFFAGRGGVMWARVLLALAVVAIGLAHFLYADITAGFVPAWLPARHFWAYLTGAGNLAAALGILFAVWPRLAATLEAAMLWLITLLVWLQPLLAHLGDSGAWSAFLMSSAIAAGASAVADSYRGLSWTTIGARQAHL